MTQAPPSIDPADLDSVNGMLRTVLRKFVMGEMDDALPAQVVAVDSRNSGMVTVRPLIDVLTTDGQRVPRGQVRVPVLQIGGGGVMLSFPVQAGDLGWIKAADRDTSLFVQNGTAVPPNTLRYHSFGDGFFIPHIMREYVIDAADNGSAVLQTTDGTQKIVIGPTGVKIKATNATVEATATVIASTTVNVNTANAVFSGTVTATGFIDV